MVEQHASDLRTAGDDYALAMLVLVAVALVASLIPARRTTRVDPVEALRYE